MNTYPRFEEYISITIAFVSVYYSIITPSYPCIERVMVPLLIMLAILSDNQLCSI